MTRRGVPSPSPAARRPAAALLAGATGAALLVPAAPALAQQPTAAQPTPVSAAAAPARDPNPPLRPTVRWRACASEAFPTKQCGYVTVPRDYDRPHGAKLRVAVSRIPATGSPQRRIGSILWDAGGPGGASTLMIEQVAVRMSPRVRARFDFVAFDPRGVGVSTPTLNHCAMPWPLIPADATTPKWATVRGDSAEALARANRRCVRNRVALANSMGTVNVARDLDRIRRAVGDRELTYWGTSYGTRIGYVYAWLFPDRVRAMVQDGSIDPTTGFQGLPEIGGTSIDLALRFMKRHDPSAYRAVIDTADDLARHPLLLDDGSRYSRWDWLNLMSNFPAFQAHWATLPRLAALVATARGSGEEAAVARELLAGFRTMENGSEGSVFSVVNCVDYAQRLSTRTQNRLITTNAAEYPIYGGQLTLQFAIGCAGLGAVMPDPVPLIRTAAQRARIANVPVLLANATHDGATPMAWAKRMQQAFSGAPLIKYRSGQHVIWGAVDSPCVNDPIDEFVLRVTLPRRDRTCAFVPPVTTRSAAGQALDLSDLALPGRLGLR